jgi:hypothetical protein
MRAPTTVARAVLSAAAAVVLLTACSGSDESSDASAGSAAGSSGATSTGSAGSSPAVEDVAAWCDRAVALSSDLEATLTAASTDPDRVAPVLQAAADEYADVEAPAPIAADWDLVVGAVQTLAAAAQDIDFTSPDAEEQLAASISDQGDALNAAAADVQAYAGANCPNASAAPTS